MKSRIDMLLAKANASGLSKVEAGEYVRACNREVRREVSEYIDTINLKTRLKPFKHEYEMGYQSNLN